MKVYYKTTMSIRTVITFLFIICIYIRSGSPFSLAYQSTTLYLHVLMSAFIMFCSVLYAPFERIKTGQWFLAILFCLSVLATMFNTNETTLYRNYVIQVLMCLDAVLIVRMVGVEKTIRCWILSMRVVTLSALFLYACVSVGISSFPIVETNSATYYTVYLASQLISTNRLSGSFWEPSMFVVFLAITLLFELLTQESAGKRGRLWIVVEIIALALTSSASAVVSLILVGFIYFYKKNERKKSRAIFVVVVFALSILSMIFFEDIILMLYDAFPSVFYKFVERDISFLTRMNNPIGDILTCVSHPFGVGVEKVEEIVRRYAVLFTGDSRAIISRTSTWSYYFAAFGWITGIVVNLIWIIGICRSRWLGGLQKIAFAVLMFYLLTSVTLINNQMYWILIVLIYVASERVELRTEAPVDGMEIET